MILFETINILKLTLKTQIIYFFATMSATIKDVVINNYCVGCGACAFIEKSGMEINKYGEYVPRNPDKIKNPRALDACPSLNPLLNEDRLADQFISDTDKFEKGIGKYDSIFAGYVIENNIRKNGTSGGMGTWIATELFNKNYINAVIHVKHSERHKYSDPFFTYQISRTIPDIKDGAKTRYHVVELSQVLKQVRETPGEYLFIGVPCMAKTIRRLQAQDEILNKRIKFVMSLVCGHLKSINWTLSLSWAAGIPPMESSRFEYRTKADNIPPRAYIFRAWNKKGNMRQYDSASVIGGKFNQGALMLPACEYCDDVVGETADVTIGDAWLPRFESDNEGTNLIISRNKLITKLIQESHKANRILIEVITSKEAYKSQSGGFRQRQEGLAYRLSKKHKNGCFVPTKRISQHEYNPNIIRRKIL